MPQPVCRFIRTKSYCTAEKTKTTLVEEKPGRAFWCIRSVSPIGPDDQLVGPSECTAARTCFDTVNVTFA